MATLTKKDILKKWESLPDDAEVMMIIGDAEDYVPILTGYAPNLNMILIQEDDTERWKEYNKERTN
jgi:hypothetical protein